MFLLGAAGGLLLLLHKRFVCLPNADWPLYLILSFFRFHFEQLRAATGLIFVLLTATVAVFVDVNEV